MILYGIFMSDLFPYHVLKSSNVIKIGTWRVIFLQGILIPLRIKSHNILFLDNNKWTYIARPYPGLLIFLPYSLICRQELACNLQQFQSIMRIPRELLWIDNHPCYPQIGECLTLDVIGVNFYNLCHFLI